jgi:hypothetical protein
MMYQEDAHFRGRIMLVDNDLINYFILDPKARMGQHNVQHMPKRLATEYNDFATGCIPGPLMEQEKLFERLWYKNNVIKSQLSMDMLSAVHHEKFENAKTPFICYCRDEMPEADSTQQIVECAHRNCSLRYFHKTCVKQLGVEKVSRWYCTRCKQEMRAQAGHILRSMGYDDIPVEEDAWNNATDMMRGSFGISADVVDQVRLTLEKAGASARLAGVMARSICLGA